LSQIIYITGVDGTGKSTQAELLAERLKGSGVRCRQLWLRFPFFLSLPLLAYARWKGLSWYEENGQVRHGYWNFRESWLLRSFLPWMLLLDAALAAFGRIYIPLLMGITVVCERFVLDILVDLAVAFRDQDIFQRFSSKLFLKLLPHNTTIFVLDLDVETIQERRTDLRLDRSLASKVAMFRQMTKDYSLSMLSSQMPIPEQSQLIWEAVEKDLPELKPTKTTSYAKLASPLVQRLLRSPGNAIVMHWVFQSLLYMDPTERRFKLCLDILITAVLGILLNIWLPTLAAWITAFLVAHTLNFLFNGQLWGILKHYGFVRQTHEQFTRYVQDLDQRAKCEPSIKYIVAYGSLSRQEWLASSDLDARIVRYPGLINGLRASWFLLCERSRALIKRFPLDVYIVDSEDSLKHLRSDENAVPLSEFQPRTQHF
jgi:thymidylate kinase